MNEPIEVSDEYCVPVLPNELVIATTACTGLAQIAMIPQPKPYRAFLHLTVPYACHYDIERFLEREVRTLEIRVLQDHKVIKAMVWRYHSVHITDFDAASKAALGFTFIACDEVQTLTHD